jgi:hypothetical protein
MVETFQTVIVFGEQWKCTHVAGSNRDVNLTDMTDQTLVRLHLSAATVLWRDIVWRTVAVSREIVPQTCWSVQCFSCSQCGSVLLPEFMLKFFVAPEQQRYRGPPSFLRSKKAITVELNPQVVHACNSGTTHLAASFLRVAANFHVCCGRHRDGSYILARCLST